MRCGDERADDHVDDRQQPATAECGCSVCHGNLPVQLSTERWWYPGLCGDKPGYLLPREGLKTAVVANDVAVAGALAGMPARTTAVRIAGGVKAQTSDHGVGMAAVRIDGDPAAAAARAPA